MTDTHHRLPPEVSWAFTAVLRAQACGEALTQGLVQQLCLRRLSNLPKVTELAESNSWNFSLVFWEPLPDSRNHALRSRFLRY